jgi:hypothetical protein
METALFAVLPIMAGLRYSAGITTKFGKALDAAGHGFAEGCFLNGRIRWPV